MEIIEKYRGLNEACKKTKVLLGGEKKEEGFAKDGFIEVFCKQPPRPREPQEKDN